MSFQASDGISGEMRHLPRPFLKQGLLVRGPGRTMAFTGRIFPRLYLLAANAEPTSIDGVAGTWFALVGVDVPLGELERFGLLRPWRDLQPRLIALVDEQAARRSTGTYSVKDERGREFLGRHRGKIMIVRPDRYVAGCAAAGQFESIGNDFATRLGLAGSRGVAAPRCKKRQSYDQRLAFGSPHAANAGHRAPARLLSASDGPAACRTGCGCRVSVDGSRRIAVVLRNGPRARCAQISFQLRPSTDLADAERALAEEGITSERRRDAKPTRQTRWSSPTSTGRRSS